MLVLAHRGAHDQARENTLAAFVHARDLGADGVELDVHRTRDGALVVHHDAALAGVGVIGDCSLAQLRAADPLLSTLDEALDACAGLMVNIEAKNLPGDVDFDASQRVADAVVGTVEARAVHDVVLVSSFNLDTIDRVRALDPRVATGFLTGAAFDPLAALRVAASRGHTAVHPQASALAGEAAARVVVAAHAASMWVTTWTVDDPREIRALEAADVDGLITDVPDVALTTLGRGPARPA